MVSRAWVKWSAVSAVLLLAGVAGAVFLLGQGSGEGTAAASGPVHVLDQNIEPRVPVEFSSVPQALVYASERTGLELHMPAHLPDGLVLTQISIKKNPPGVGLRGAYLKFGGGTRYVELAELSQRFSFGPPIEENVIASPRAGVTIYRAGPNDGTPRDYVLLTETRSYLLGNDISKPLTDEEAINMLSSLPLSDDEQVGSDVRVAVIDTNSQPPLKTEFSNVSQAVAYATEKAGFHVYLPGYVPDGFAVTEIVIQRRPPPVANAPWHRGVDLRITGKAGMFHLAEMAFTFQFPGDEEENVIARPTDGVRIFRGSTEYTMMTPTRGYALGWGPDYVVAEAEAVKILSSLAMD